MFAQLFAEEVSSIVINEVHHNPPDNTVRQEFIELYNPLDEALSLDGWRLSGAVDFNFPEGANLAAKSYVVIAEDPDRPGLSLACRWLVFGLFLGRMYSRKDLWSFLVVFSMITHIFQ